MSDTCKLSCTCGQMHWHIKAGADGRHLICYCPDCQTGTRHLGKQDSYLTDGGTQIFQTTPDNFVVDQGAEHLGLMRLGPKGLFRWYATCCDTPIANTLPNPTLPFVGAVLPAGTDHFGRATCHANTDSATKKIRQRGVPGAVYSLFWRAAKALISGKDKFRPFFNPDKTPVVTAKVLTLEERNSARP